MSNIKENGIRSSDNFNLLVFIKVGKSVKISQLSRAYGDFNDYEILIPKAKAIFVKDQKGYLNCQNKDMGKRFFQQKSLHIIFHLSQNSQRFFK